MPDIFNLEEIFDPFNVKHEGKLHAARSEGDLLTETVFSSMSSGEMPIERKRPVSGGGSGSGSGQGPTNPSDDFADKPGENEKRLLEAKRQQTLAKRNDLQLVGIVSGFGESIEEDIMARLHKATGSSGVMIPFNRAAGVDVGTRLDLLSKRMNKTTGFDGDLPTRWDQANKRAIKGSLNKAFVHLAAEFHDRKTGLIKAIRNESNNHARFY